MMHCTRFLECEKFNWLAKLAEVSNDEWLYCKTALCLVYSLSSYVPETKSSDQFYLYLYAFSLLSIANGFVCWLLLYDNYLLKIVYNTLITWSLKQLIYILYLICNIVSFTYMHVLLAKNVLGERFQLTSSHNL